MLENSNSRYKITADKNRGADRNSQMKHLYFFINHDFLLNAMLSDIYHYIGFEIFV